MSRHKTLSLPATIAHRMLVVFGYIRCALPFFFHLLGGGGGKVTILFVIMVTDWSFSIFR